MAGKRLAESKSVTTTQREQGQLTTIQHSSVLEDEDQQETGTNSESTPENSVSASITSLTSSLPSTTHSDKSIGAETCLNPMRDSSVFAALFTNGLILGLRCGIQIPILSPPCTPKVPPPLRPTRLQMTILHIPWIDRFPFPKMRDNVIRLSCEGFDEDELFSDIFIRESFTITPGSLSWDPAGWNMAKSFQCKWGHLFL
jgi:hypothetical protein